MEVIINGVEYVPVKKREEFELEAIIKKIHRDVLGSLVENEYKKTCRSKTQAPDLKEKDHYKYDIEYKTLPNNSGYAELKEVALALRAYIDSIPRGVSFDLMPGVDRDCGDDMKARELIKRALVGAVNYEESFIDSMPDEYHLSESNKKVMAETEKLISEYRKYYEKRFGEKLYSNIRG